MLKHWLNWSAFDEQVLLVGNPTYKNLHKYQSFALKHNVNVRNLCIIIVVYYYSMCNSCFQDCQHLAAEIFHIDTVLFLLLK